MSDDRSNAFAGDWILQSSLASSSALAWTTLIAPSEITARTSLRLRFTFTVATLCVPHSVQCTSIGWRAVWTYTAGSSCILNQWLITIDLALTGFSVPVTGAAGSGRGGWTFASAFIFVQDPVALAGWGGWAFAGQCCSVVDFAFRAYRHATTGFITPALAQITAGGEGSSAVASALITVPGLGRVAIGSTIDAVAGISSSIIEPTLRTLENTLAWFLILPLVRLSAGSGITLALAPTCNLRSHAGGRSCAFVVFNLSDFCGNLGSQQTDYQQIFHVQLI